MKFMLYVLFCLSLHMARDERMRGCDQRSVAQKRQNVFRHGSVKRLQYYVYVRFLDYRYFRNILH